MTSTANDVAAPVAVVTGASSGIGALYADRLARRGFDLILVARDRPRLAAVAARLVADTGRRAAIVAADLGRAEERLPIERMLRDDGRIVMLVNCAGVGTTATVAEADARATGHMIDLYVAALASLTLAAVPAFLARGTGTVVNIGSVVAVAPEVLTGAAYAGTKAFVLAFTTALALELAASPVRVQVVLPGATATPFGDAAGTPIAAVPTERVMAAADVVDAALAGLDAGESVTIPSLPNVADWHAYETARLALIPNLSRTTVAARYGAHR